MSILSNQSCVVQHYNTPPHYYASCFLLMYDFTNNTPNISMVSPASSLYVFETCHRWYICLRVLLDKPNVQLKNFVPLHLTVKEVELPICLTKCKSLNNSIRKDLSKLFLSNLKRQIILFTRVCSSK